MSGVWSASGALVDVNTLLAGVTFNPTLDYNANFSIATSVDDGTITINGNKAMTGTAADDAPTATNLIQVKAYNEGDPTVALDDSEVSEVDTMLGQTITSTLTLAIIAAWVLI